jgi:tRNA-dihydrouridine synthase
VAAIQIRNLLINPPFPLRQWRPPNPRRMLIDFGVACRPKCFGKKPPTENPVSPYLIRTERKAHFHQLLTSTDQEIGRDIDALHAFKADAVDLNMGCPSTAVGKFGAGVMLMERPDEARRIVAETRKRTALPLSAKIRLGSDATAGN